VSLARCSLPQSLQTNSEPLTSIRPPSFPSTSLPFIVILLCDANDVEFETLTQQFKKNDLLPIALDGFLNGRFYWKRHFYKIHIWRVLLQMPLTVYGRRYTGCSICRKVDRILAAILDACLDYIPNSNFRFRPISKVEITWKLSHLNA
jgi:hypothetical protein